MDSLRRNFPGWFYLMFYRKCVLTRYPMMWECGVLSSDHEKINGQATWQEYCWVMNHYSHLWTSPLLNLLIVFKNLMQVLDAIWRNMIDVSLVCVCVPCSGKRESLWLCQIERNAHQSEHGGPSRADSHTPLWTVPPLQTGRDGLQGHGSGQQALQVVTPILLVCFWSSCCCKKTTFV